MATSDEREKQVVRRQGIGLCSSDRASRRALLAAAIASSGLGSTGRSHGAAAASLPSTGPDQGVLWIEDNNLGRAGGMTPDFPAMFGERAADWAATREYLGVYLLRLNTLRKQAGTLTDEFLHDAFLPALESWGIALAVDGVGATWAECRGGDEAVERELAQIARLVRLGGTVRYVSLQSALSKPSRRCPEYRLDAGYDLRIGDVVRYAGLVKERYPTIGVGLIDALPAKGWVYEPIYEQLVDALEQRGLNLAYLHLDFPMELASAGWENARIAEEFVRQRLGLRFGITYTTMNGGRSSNEAFHLGVLSAFLDYQAAGGRPDDLLLMSWYPHPTCSLPEDATDDFPYMRTALELARLGGVAPPTRPTDDLATGW